jgi:hypothetical protein
LIDDGRPEAYHHAPTTQHPRPEPGNHENTVRERETQGSRAGACVCGGGCGGHSESCSTQCEPGGLAIQAVLRAHMICGRQAVACPHTHTHTHIGARQSPLPPSPHPGGGGGARQGCTAKAQATGP